MKTVYFSPYTHWWQGSVRSVHCTINTNHFTFCHFFNKWFLPSNTPIFGYLQQNRCFLLTGNENPVSQTWTIYFCFCISEYGFFLWRCDSTRVITSSFLMFLDHTQRRTTVGRTPLDEWSARRRDLYLTTHNRHTSMPPGGIRTHDLSRRAAADQRLRPRGHWDRQNTDY